MLLAVAMMLAAPDHWAAFAPASSGHAHHHGAHATASHGEREHHARHCHGDAATCSDVPLTALSGLAALAAWAAFGLAGTARPLPLPPTPRWRSLALRVPQPPPRCSHPARLAFA
jgi:hypothetical protein